MAADQYCLKWNNHQSTLLVQFETLLESDSLTDCTLSAEGKYLNVHKVLLSACSPYFSKLLGEHKDKHPIFFMKDVAFEELKGIVEYMYKGEVNIMQERLDSFLKTASSLQIKGLADQDGGKGEDAESDPGGGRVKRKQAPDLRGGYGDQSPMPEEPRSPKRRRRPRPVSQDDSLPPQDQNHCDTTTSAPAYVQQQQEVVMPTPLVPVKKTEPVDNSMMNLKTEIPDDVPQVDVQDLTLDDDEDFNNEDITQPGTSYSETSQDFAQWQQQMATQSGADESFMAATQGINQSGSQGFKCSSEPDLPSNFTLKNVGNPSDLNLGVDDYDENCSESNDEGLEQPSFVKPSTPRCYLPHKNKSGTQDKEKPKFICICGQGFVCAVQLAKHRLTSCGMLYECKFCLFKTESDVYIIRHLAAQHGEEITELIVNENVGKFAKAMVCGCGYRAPSRRAMTIHRRLDCKILLQCIYCDFQSKLQSEIFSHVTRKHYAMLLNVMKSNSKRKLDNRTRARSVGRSRETSTIKNSFYDQENLTIRHVSRERNDNVPNDKFNPLFFDQESDDVDSDESTPIYFDNVCRNALPVSRFGDLPLRVLSEGYESSSERSFRLRDTKTKKLITNGGISCKNRVVNGLAVTSGQIQNSVAQPEPLNQSTRTKTNGRTPENKPQSPSDNNFCGFNQIVTPDNKSKLDFFAKYYPRSSPILNNSFIMIRDPRLFKREIKIIVRKQ